MIKLGFLGFALDRMLLLLFDLTILSNNTFWQSARENKSMEQSIDCQPHFGHPMWHRKASYANHTAQVVCNEMWLSSNLA
jgi:hypothetical protein